VNRWRGLVRCTAKDLYDGRCIVVACNFVALMTWGIGIFNQGVFRRTRLHRLNPGDKYAQRGAVRSAFRKFQ
jgi:hypothetical protein